MGLTVPSNIILTDVQVSDPMLQPCSFCGHCSTNTLEEDDKFVEANRIKLQQNDNEIRIWEYETSCQEAAADDGQQILALPLIPNTNKEMKRRHLKIGKAQMRQARLIYFCFALSCMQKGLDHEHELSAGWWRKMGKLLWKG